MKARSCALVQKGGQRGSQPLPPRSATLQNPLGTTQGNAEHAVNCPTPSLPGCFRQHLKHSALLQGPVPGRKQTSAPSHWIFPLVLLIPSTELPMCSTRCLPVPVCAAVSHTGGIVPVIPPSQGPSGTARVPWAVTHCQELQEGSAGRSWKAAACAHCHCKESH